MRKVYLYIIVAGLLSFFDSNAQTTATDFTANDCAGNPHHLFAELNAGKVVVISFVEPCASCIGPTQSANSNVKNWLSTYPGRIVFYIADDVGNTNCTTLSTWASTNGMGDVPTITNSTVKQTDYGVAAMPKIVVLAGGAHRVMFVQNNGLNVTNFNNAITQAFQVTGISSPSIANLKLNLYPNPSYGEVRLAYSLSKSEETRIEITDLSGKCLMTFTDENQPAGDYEKRINTEGLKAGYYFLRLTAGDATETLRFCIIR